MNRLYQHPIIEIPQYEFVSFTFNGKKLIARKGEMISSALFASGIQIFGFHPVDGSPQGIFCANGQCSQCLVIADGVCVKACMTPVREGMVVNSYEGLAELGPVSKSFTFEETQEIRTEVLIVGAGPAGLSAAETLGSFGISGIVVDDKPSPGGKLTLQTHSFFGSRHACFAGTRGIEIARILTQKVEQGGKFEIWRNATAVGVFVDKKIGVVREGKYILISPECLLVAAGAREKTLVFEGCDLPGIYGAGAFQTLLNRDLVIPTKRLLVVGGGNVGLIAAYHALQAGIEVAGIVEALPHVGGYKVHLDKIKRAGVPVWTSRTILRAEGKEKVEKVVLIDLDKKLRPIRGTEEVMEVDTVLIAVGLLPVNELYIKAKEYGIPSWTAGDSAEIAEASAAMFGGKIAGLEIAKHFGRKTFVPEHLIKTQEILKSRPGKIFPLVVKNSKEKIRPVVRCVQQIPCNPCTDVCPVGKIVIRTDNIMDLPEVTGQKCLGCGNCVIVCPGLAITLIFDDYDPSKKTSLIVVPYEMDIKTIEIGKEVTTTDMEGKKIGKGIVAGIKHRAEFTKRLLVAVEVPWKDRMKVAGIVVKEPSVKPVRVRKKIESKEDYIVCRCSRVKKSEIVAEIRRGVRDFSELKATLRTGMGACGGKTCTPLIERIFAEEGIKINEVSPPTIRPFTTEVPMGIFAGVKECSKHGSGESE